VRGHVLLAARRVGRPPEPDFLQKQQFIRDIFLGSAFFQKMIGSFFENLATQKSISEKLLLL